MKISWKNYILLVSALGLLASCEQNAKPKPDPNPLETATLKCIIDEHKAVGVDVMNVFHQLQQIAVQTGNLKDTSAQSYFELFQKSAQQSYFPIQQEEVYFNKLSQVANFPPHMYCRGHVGLSDSIVSTSKLNLYNQYLAKEIRSARGQRKQPNVAAVVMQTYSAEDFENIYVKYAMLTFISYRSSMENKIYREIGS